MTVCRPSSVLRPLKRISIDAFIRWAWADEWPKAQPDMRGPAGFSPAWDRIGDWRVGGVNRFGVSSILDCDRPVHPDAVRLFDALAALDRCEIALPDDWNPMADLAATPRDGASPRDVENACLAARARALAGVSAIDRNGRRRMKGAPRALLLKCAALKAPPAWEAEPFEVRAMRRNGKPLWFVREQRTDSYGLPYEAVVDGYDHRRGRPKPGAWRQWECAPDPVPALMGRAEYEIWRSSLAMLTEELAGMGLTAHRVVMVDAPERPWEEGAPAARRVWSEGLVLDGGSRLA